MTSAIGSVRCKARQMTRDTISADRWLIPLTWYATDASLTENALRYLRQDAPTRRRYEAAIDLMSGERQREVWIRNVLGGMPVAQLRHTHGLGKSAVRTARWRARRLVEVMAPALY